MRFNWVSFESAVWYTAALLTAFTSFFNVLLVSLTAKRILTAVKIKFILYSSALTLWSVNVFFFTYVKDERISYLCLQLLHLGAIFIPVFLLDFVITFFDIQTKTLPDHWVWKL